MFYTIYCFSPPVPHACEIVTKFMIFDSLRELYSLGWNPIPIHVFLSQDTLSRQKRPPVRWKPYADSPALYSPSLIDQWEEESPTSDALGVAVITGKQRDGTFVVCVDIDTPKNNSRLTIPDELVVSCSSTMSTLTPSGGRH